MRLSLGFLFPLWLVVTSLVAQVPSAFNFQAAVRSSEGVPIINRPVRVQVEIQQGSVGPVIYREQHLDTTNGEGIMILEVGRGTGNSSISFSSINWGLNPYYVKLAVDTSGSGNYINLGSYELLSVPYAQFSGNGLPSSGSAGQMLQWNGSAWVSIPPGAHNQVLTICDGRPTWTQARTCPSIVSISCGSANSSGSLFSGVLASAASSAIPYVGNGGNHYGQIVASTGVTGLTATLNAGSFVNGSGSLSYTITGRPSGVGIASFAIRIGGQNCTLTRSVGIAGFRAGFVYCGNSQIVDVLNPNTGKIWMDRNLGANRSALFNGDSLAMGGLFQWGRFADGHQCLNSSTSNVLSSGDVPGHSAFILSNTGNVDWRVSINDNLWQGENGVNNPCPVGYRLPTETELNAERSSWVTNNNSGAFNSPIRLCSNPQRRSSDGALLGLNEGFYWTSTISGTQARSLVLSGSAYFDNNNRASGLAVRCIKN